MLPTDLRNHEHDSVLRAEVCIIGSGPSGTSIALHLAEAGVDVLILEGGGYEHEDDTQALYDIESVGLIRAPQEEIRVRRFGGTSTLWTGRVAPFRDIDFEPRSWIPASGWPFSRAEFEPYLKRASRFIGVAPGSYTGEAWLTFSGKTPTNPLDPSQLVDQLWQFSEGTAESEPVRVNIDYAEQLGNAPNIRTLLHANVLEVVPDPSGSRVDHVLVSTLEGKRARVESRTVIVACGGIENARLLLASRSITPSGLGNNNDMVGRYFMEHPYADVAEFDVTTDLLPIMSRFGHYWQDGQNVKQVYLCGMSLSARVQREQELLNCSMYLMPVNDDSAAIQAARRLAASRNDGSAGHNVKDVRVLLGRPFELAQAAKRRALEGLPPVVPPLAVTLGANAEQMPDRDSRITLSDQVDSLGVPLSKIDWRMHDLEIETIRVMFALVQDELQRLGLPSPRPAPWLANAGDWRRSFVDTAHHTGSTRMADDAHQGVTDRWGHVHGVDGLYVAGSSTFPTVGTANPTLMIVAQAMRVADAVQERHAVSSTPASSTPVPATPWSGPPRQRVAFVGCGDRVETMYMPVVRALADRFNPVGFTARNPQHQSEFSERTGVSAYDSVEALLDEASPDLLVVAVSPEASQAVIEGLLGGGVPLLVETPWAWSTRNSQSLFDKLSRSAVIGVAEQSPFLPHERLRLKLLEEGVLGALVAVHNESGASEHGGISQLRRYVGAMSQPLLATAAQGTVALRTPGKDLAAPPRRWRNATIAYAGGLTASHRHVESDDSGLRPQRRVRLDGELGTCVNDDIRTIDRRAGTIATGTIVRDEHGSGAQTRLLGLDLDMGNAGELRWENPFSAHVLTDEQIAVASHLVAIADSALGRGRPLYGPDDAFKDVELVNAIAKAAKRGRSVSLRFNPRLGQAKAALSPASIKTAYSRIEQKVRR